MTPVAETYTLAYERVREFDTSDASSLAYVSALIAIELVLPDLVAEELDFSVTIGRHHSLHIESKEMEANVTLCNAIETIEAIASHCFHTARFNLPLAIH